MRVRQSHWHMVVLCRLSRNRLAEKRKTQFFSRLPSKWTKKRHAWPIRRNSARNLLDNSKLLRFHVLLAFCVILFIIPNFAIRLGTTCYQVMHLSPWMISDGQKNFGTMPICNKEKLLSSDKMFGQRFSKSF